MCWTFVTSVTAFCSTNCSLHVYYHFYPSQYWPSFAHVILSWQSVNVVTYHDIFSAYLFICFSLEHIFTFVFNLRDSQFFYLTISDLSKVIAPSLHKGKSSIINKILIYILISNNLHNIPVFLFPHFTELFILILMIFLTDFTLP